MVDVEKIGVSARGVGEREKCYEAGVGRSAAGPYIPFDITEGARPDLYPAESTGTDKECNS